MTRFFAPLVLLVLSMVAVAADKVVYSTAELQVSGKNDVDAIVAQFVEDTEATTPVEPERMMFLVDGEAVERLDDYLPRSDRVEVMSDGTYIIINVVMQAEAEVD
ncbi:hypothetical protein [Halomonas denitrificans]|nr:hypothetical protein [Halomonas denitrificans]